LRGIAKSAAMQQSEAIRNALASIIIPANDNNHDSIRGTVSFPSTFQREVFIRNHLIVQGFELIDSFLQNSGILMKKCYN